MQPDDDFQSQNDGLRSVLRLIGPLMVGVGAIFLIVGMVSFFSAFGGFEPPRQFWCAFVGMPLVGIGIGICKFAYLGTFTRYVAGEVAPVGKDVVNYMAEGTKDSMRDVAAAVAGGLREGMHSTEPLGESAAAPEVRIRCRSCHALNDESAKFCGQCGKPL
jgi:hypothetical protein